MAGPIYVFGASRMKEAWYQLSEEERESLWAKVHAIGEKCGVKLIIRCTSMTAEWPHWGVFEFPDIEALQRNNELSEEIGWFRYVESGHSMLGTKWEPS